MSGSDVARVDTRELADDELERRLITALKARGGKATEADLVVDSGVPPHQVGPGMRKLLSLYESDLDVTEQGHLVYRFAPSFERRDVVPWARTKKVAGVLWRGFKAVYKVAITVVLVGYVAAFALLAIAALVAMASARDNNSSSSRSSRDSDWGGRGGGLFFFWNPFGTWIPWGLGPAPARRRRRLGPDGQPDKPFWKKVFAFVFGPEEPGRDALADERGLLAFIRERGGVVAPSELVARTGWSLDAADKESTKLLARYGGDVEVTEGGEMLYVFKDLMTTAGGALAAVDPAPPPVWERYEKSEALTGNTVGANVGIALMNGFVLTAATVLMPNLIAPQLRLDMANAWVQGALVIAPTVYAALFFLIPAARALGVSRRNGQRALRNVRRAVMREAFAGRSPDPKLVAGIPPSNVPMPSRDAAALAPVVRSIANELGGEASTEGDDLSWTFPRLREEAEAATARRRGGEAKLVRVGDEALAFTTR